MGANYREYLWVRYKVSERMDTQNTTTEPRHVKTSAADLCVGLKTIAGNSGWFGWGGMIRHFNIQSLDRII